MSHSGDAIKLNPAQREAVEHLHGPALVIAGAGTGKTRVITERILHLLQTIPDLDGKSILALTYTNKAAGEMAGRIRRRGGRRAADVRVATFHEYCLELLRAHGKPLRLLDKIDYWIFLRRNIPQLGLNLYKKRSDPGKFLNDFTQFFSRCQDELVSPADYRDYTDRLAAALEKEGPSLNEDDRRARADDIARQSEIAGVYEKAEALLLAAGCTTFGGLLISAVRLLESNEQLLAQVQDELRYVVVDEFQDTNVAQNRFLELLTAKHRNLMAVGDDDQAIYRFRGASYATFAQFLKLFPDAVRITLTRNYRSTDRILKVAGELIAQNGPARFDPNKKLVANAPGGEAVQLAELPDANAEAAHVAGAIQRRQEATGEYSGMAVLYRAHSQREALVGELTQAGIPFVIRRLSILTNPLVRDLLAYLRCIRDPGSKIAFVRLLAMPAWKVSPEFLLELVARARKEKQSLHQTAAALHADILREQTAIGDLLDLLSEFRTRAGKEPVVALFDALAERVGVGALPGDPDLPAVEAFRNFLNEWQEEKSATKRLRELIEYFDYFEEAGGTINLTAEGAGGDAVELMTVHSSKGLEFDTVFVLRLNQSDFPTKYRRPLFEFPIELMKEALPPGRDILIQEERRLCYVAFTRARRQLHLSTLTGKRKKLSVFLEDVLRSPKSSKQIHQFAPEGASAKPEPERQSQQRLFRRGVSDQIYSRITAWAEGPTGATAPQPLTLSHSSIDTYDRCPLRYKFSELWKLPGTATPPLVFGLIMHRCVAEYFKAQTKGKGVDETELRHIYDIKWAESGWPFEDAFQKEDYYQTGWEQFSAFHQQQREEPDAFLESEKTFEWNQGEIVLTGRIDQVNRAADKTIEIVEYKTGEPQEPKFIEKSRQLALYALAAENAMDRRVGTVTLYNLTVNESHSFVPDEKRLEKTLEATLNIAARIRAGHFPAKPNFFCRSCDYRGICPAQEQAPPPRITAPGETVN